MALAVLTFKQTINNTKLKILSREEMSALLVRPQQTIPEGNIKLHIAMLPNSF